MDSVPRRRLKPRVASLASAGGRGRGGRSSSSGSPALAPGTNASAGVFRRTKFERDAHAVRAYRLHPVHVLGPGPSGGIDVARQRAARILYQYTQLRALAAVAPQYAVRGHLSRERRFPAQQDAAVNHLGGQVRVRAVERARRNPVCMAEQHRQRYQDSCQNWGVSNLVSESFQVNHLIRVPDGLPSIN